MASTAVANYGSRRRGVLERFRGWARVSERRFDLRLLSEKERQEKGISSELFELENYRPFWDVPQNWRK